MDNDNEFGYLPKSSGHGSRVEFDAHGVAKKKRGIFDTKKAKRALRGEGHSGGSSSRSTPNWESRYYSEGHAPKGADSYEMYMDDYYDYRGYSTGYSRKSHVTDWSSSNGSYASSWGGRFGGGWQGSYTSSQAMLESVRVSAQACMTLDNKIGDTLIDYAWQSSFVSEGVYGGTLALNGFVHKWDCGESVHDIVVGDALLAAAARGEFNDINHAQKNFPEGRYNRDVLVAAAAMVASKKRISTETPGFVPYVKIRSEWYEKCSAMFPSPITADIVTGLASFRDTPEREKLAESCVAATLAIMCDDLDGSIADSTLKGFSDESKARIAMKFNALQNCAAGLNTLTAIERALAKLFPVDISEGAAAAEEDRRDLALQMNIGVVGKEGPCVLMVALGALGLLRSGQTTAEMPCPEGGGSGRVGDGESEGKKGDPAEIKAAANWDPKEDWEHTVYVYNIKEYVKRGQRDDGRMIPSCNNDSTASVTSSHSKRVASMAGSINALKSKMSFRDSVRSVETHSWRGGDLDCGSLHKVLMGADTVFSKVEEEYVPNVLVLLVLDRSGSMARWVGERNQFGQKTRWDVVADTATALAHALDGMNGVDFAVYSHTTDFQGATSLEIIKTHDGPTSDIVHVEYLSAGYGNLDGTILKEIARKTHREVDMSKYNDVVLFLISDGQPCGGTSKVNAYETVKRGKEFAQTKGIRVYGIGIDNAYDDISGKIMYGDGGFIVLKDTTELTTRLGTWITKICSK